MGFAGATLFNCYQSYEPQQDCGSYESLEDLGVEAVLASAADLGLQNVPDMVRRRNPLVNSLISWEIRGTAFALRWPCKGLQSLGHGRFDPAGQWDSKTAPRSGCTLISLLCEVLQEDQSAAQ